MGNIEAHELCIRSKYAYKEFDPEDFDVFNWRKSDVLKACELALKER